MKFCDFRCLSNSHALEEAGGNRWRYFNLICFRTAHLHSHNSYLAFRIAAVFTPPRMGQVEVHEMSRCRLDPRVGIFRDRTSRHCNSTLPETPAVYHVLHCACTSINPIRSICIPTCTPKKSRRVRPGYLPPRITCTSDPHTYSRPLLHAQSFLTNAPPI